MADITIKVKYEGSDGYTKVSLPSDAKTTSIKRVRDAMISKLDLAAQEPDRDLTGFELYHEKSQQVLSNSQTFEDVGVEENDSFEIRRVADSGDAAEGALSAQVTAQEETDKKPVISGQWARVAKIAAILLGAVLVLLLIKNVIPTDQPPEEEFRTQILSKAWQFSHGEGDVIAEHIRLLPDGTIEGYYHPNESRWDFEGDIVVFYHESGEPSCRFTAIHSEGGRLIMSGPLLFDPETIHVLTEIRPH